MESRDFKTHATYFNILSPVSELSHYRICSLLGQRFRFAQVRARGSHGNACYAQVIIQENSSHVVIIDAPYWLGSQPSALTECKLWIS